MSIDKDQVKGRTATTKGGLKEAAGRLTGDRKLEVRGNLQKNVGKLRAKYGDAKQGMKTRGT